MIHITYHRIYHRLTVRGHAGYAPAGQDLVCAAVSALTYTLAAAAEKLHNNGQAITATVQLDPGNATVCCRPHHRFRAETTVIFDAICEGYGILAADYPDCVAYQVRG